MSVDLFMVFGLGLVPAAVVILLVVVLIRTAHRPAPAPSEAAQVARRHGATVNAVAWLIALLASPLALGAVALPVIVRTAVGGLHSGVVAGLYPMTLGLLFLAVHAVGELTWPRPTGRTRRAALLPREEVAPRWLLIATWAWAATLAGALVIGGLTSSDHHTIERVTGSGSSAGAGPYPGWFFGVPLLVAAAVLLAATHAVLRLVARRPAVVDADPAYDAASRRLSGHRVLRGTQLVLALTLAGVLFFAGISVRGIELVGLGTGLAVLALVVALTGTALAAIPGRAAVLATDMTLGPPAADPSTPAHSLAADADAS